MVMETIGLTDGEWFCLPRDLGDCFILACHYLFLTDLTINIRDTLTSHFMTIWRETV